MYHATKEQLDVISWQKYRSSAIAGDANSLDGGDAVGSGGGDDNNRQSRLSPLSGQSTKSNHAVDDYARALTHLDSNAPSPRGIVSDKCDRWVLS